MDEETKDVVVLFTLHSRRSNKMQGLFLWNYMYARLEKLKADAIFGKK